MKDKLENRFIKDIADKRWVATSSSFVPYASHIYYQVPATIERSIHESEIRK